MAEAKDALRDAAPLFTLYVREGCHLCTEMACELAAVADARALRFAEVDIDADPQLVAAYDHKVPVLTFGDYEVCHYFLDADALHAVLDYGGPPP